ncbi:hypothetical protein [Streptomyces tricolor]
MGGPDGPFSPPVPATLATALQDTTRRPNPPLHLTLGSSAYDAVL